MANYHLNIDKTIGYFKNRNEYIGFLIISIQLILFIVSSYNPNEFDTYDFQKFTDLANILALAIGFYIIKPTALLIEDKEFHSLYLKLNIIKYELKNLNVRINESVKQLVKSIHWFILLLLGFYLLQFALNYSNYNFSDINLEFQNSTTIIDLMACYSETKETVVSNGIQFIIIEFFLNTFNLLSAAALFVSFKILFEDTLSRDAKNWKLDLSFPIGLALSIVVLNIIFVVVEFGLNLEIKTAIIRLLGGLYNGIVMALLFARFVSMEYFFKSAKQSFDRNFYYYGTLFILPFYVVIQPFYALFNLVHIENAENSSIIFQNFVFSVCFIGKVVFLFLIFNVINKRWLHAYILVSITKGGLVKEIAKTIKSVDLFNPDDQNNNGNKKEEN